MAAAGKATAPAEPSAHETKVRGCSDMLRALGMTRDDLLRLLGELKIEHTDKTRLSELSVEALEQLGERLDQEAAGRGDGGPTNPPPGREPKATQKTREPGEDS
jgi:hypothetical protein